MDDDFNIPQVFYMPGDVLVAKRSFGSALGFVNEGDVACVLQVEPRYAGQDVGNHDMFLLFRGCKSRPLSPAAEAWDNDWEVL